MNNCTICNKEYPPKVHNSKFCSDSCRVVAKNNTTANWAKNNTTHLNNYNKNRYLLYKKEKIAKDKVYRAKKMKEDPEYKLRQNLRKRLSTALRKNTKVGSAVRDLGCSIKEFRAYIESLWLPDMTWDNYGRKEGVRCWELDHKIPLSFFNILDRDGLLKACHYTNLQPLWAEDNWRKHDKILSKTDSIVEYKY